MCIRDRCAPSVDGDFSYSYSFSYNDVDGMFRRSCAAPDPADYLELTMYPFDGGDCGDEFSYPMKQLWNTALCQDQGGTAVQYRCDDDDGFHIDIFVGSSCDGEPFMTYGEGAFPYPGPTGECLSSGGMGFKVSCTPWFGLLDGALVSGPAHVLPSSELKRLHDERSSHGLPAPTAEEELALQNARQLTAWQAQANKIHRRLWKGTSQQAYADCQQAHRGGGSNKSCGYHSCPHHGGAPAFLYHRLGDLHGYYE